MEEFVAPFVSALVGVIVGVVSTSWKARKDLEAQYDVDLRTRRIDVYRRLWAQLQPLARYSRPGPVTGETLARVSRAMRSSYFEDGGLFLSEESRRPYFALQKALARTIARTDDPKAELDARTFVTVFRRTSELRRGMTEDVRTRKESALELAWRRRPRRRR